ncbi:unnamed protein product, partial [Brenthis ino]
MESVSASTQVLYAQRENNAVYKTEYELDFWEEVRRRWMIVGVLSAVAMAVLTSHYGASGGIFHTQYIVYIPLIYIYYNAGRTQVHACRTRLYALTVLHAHVVGLALSVVTVNALSVALDRRVIEGTILASVARPCAWLPLSFNKDGVTPTIVAINYTMSFIFSPLAHLFLCGRVPLPTLNNFIITVLTSLVPFGLGYLSHKTEIDTTSTKISALIVLYTECCNLLTEAEGSLYITDVMATLFLVISWLSTVAASSYLYVRCGLLTLNEAYMLLLIATPKSTHIEWLSSSVCASGLARLPAVFIAPAQALLLAAITSDYQNGDELPR